MKTEHVRKRMELFRDRTCSFRISIILYQLSVFAVHTIRLLRRCAPRNDESSDDTPLAAFCIKLNDFRKSARMKYYQ